MNTCELATNHAIDFFISDLGDNTHNQFYDALCDNVIPESFYLRTSMFSTYFTLRRH